MDWVHCNKCYVQPGSVEGKKFLITNCGHIYCVDCSHLPELKKCIICQSPYSTMLLSSNMSKDVEMYFLDPVEDVQKKMKILEFQQGHRNRLWNFIREKLARCAKIEKEILTLKEGKMRLEAEVQRLRQENKCIRLELNEFKGKVMKISQEKKGDFVSSLGHLPMSVSSNKSTPNVKYNDESYLTPTRVFKRPTESKYFVTPNDGHLDAISSLKAAIPGLGASGLQRSGSLYTISPSTPDSGPSRREQHHRKMMLPGDKKSQSPGMRSALQRLTLAKLTSTPKREFSRKYSHYFK